MSERTANSMAKQINRTKELKEELQKVKETLAEKEEELAKLADVSGIGLLHLKSIHPLWKIWKSLPL